MDEPEVQRLKRELEKIYGWQVIDRFWYCLPHARPIWGKSVWVECFTRGLSELKSTLPVNERYKVDKFLEDMPKLQKPLREFLTSLMREKVEEEKRIEEEEKKLSEEAEKLKKKLTEIL
jgi:hypothetical protein